MDLLVEEIKGEIQDSIIVSLINGDLNQSVIEIEKVLRKMYDLIPDNKRISYGRVHTIKVLSQYLFSKEIGAGYFEQLFDYTDNWYAKSTALGIISHYAVKDYKPYLGYFEKAASSKNWDIREMAQMFFRKIIKKYPMQMQEYLLNLTSSEDENLRRFVSETIRPVCENRWFQKEPEYSLRILREMFNEKSAYPRTSVGNNLSDLARQNPELIYSIVNELVSSGDKNSYWIAYRACRNLVKKEPERVMNLLKVDEYKYKKAKYTRNRNNS